MSWRNIINLVKIVKDTPEIPEVTEALKGSSIFQTFVKKVEFTKLKSIQLLDEAAFPENYKNEKLLEYKKREQSKSE